MGLAQSQRIAIDCYLPVFRIDSFLIEKFGFADLINIRFKPVDARSACLCMTPQPSSDL